MDKPFIKQAFDVLTSEAKGTFKCSIKRRYLTRSLFRLYNSFFELQIYFWERAFPKHTVLRRH